MLLVIGLGAYPFSRWGVSVEYDTYTDDALTGDHPRGWEMEAEESPLAACLREVTEELGVSASPRGLLVMDWVPPTPPRTPTLHWSFRVEVSSEEFVLPEEELSGWTWVPPRKPDEYLMGGVARRMITAVRVDDRAGEPVYLENGHPVLPGNT